MWESWALGKWSFGFWLMKIIGELIQFICSSSSAIKHPRSCDSVLQGYQCEPEISHYWGQYSPFYSVPSEISADVPRGCSVTFAQVLSRHGARDPTVSLSQ